MKSFLPWQGGKSQLAKTITSIIPEHTCYCEVFAGAGHVYFYKEPSKVEVLNDINKELINLYRVVQNHLEEFLRSVKWYLVSRDEFERLKAMKPETLTDIQRAVRFWYNQKNAFGGKTNKPTFGYSPTCPPRLNLLRIEEDLSAVHLRLARTVIECLDYFEILKRYDREGTLFYLDPPYWNCEDDYGKGLFEREDFQTIADMCSKLKGKFIMSINDVPEIRDMFAAFDIQNVQTTYSIGKTKKVQELLIKNF